MLTITGFRSFQIILAILLSTFYAVAATFTPITVTDLINDINTANTNGQPNIIDLGQGVFILTAVNNVTTGNNGLPVILSNGGNSLTIMNGTIERSTAVATPDFRLLEVANGAQLIVNNVTVQNGVIDSGLSGGGIFNLGTLQVQFSSFNNNTADFSGGGIYNDPTATNLSVTSSTFSGNVSSRGGGIGSDAPISFIEDSTFSGNMASTGVGIGGGLYTNDTLNVLDNNTFSGNSALTGGGGVFNDDVIDNLVSNIIAQNTAPQNPDIENDGSIVNASFNLIGIDVPTDPGSHTIINGVNNNQVGSLASPINPRLGPLANNGGPTLTMALLPTSPAINTGANPLALPYDQRGPVYLRTMGGQTDIGAYECQCAGCFNNCTNTSVVTNSAELVAAVCMANSDGVNNIIDCQGANIVLTGNNTCAGQPINPTTSAIPPVAADGGTSTIFTNCTISVIPLTARVMTIEMGANVTVNNSTLSSGFASATSDPNGGNGGGINNSGTLALMESTVGTSIAANDGGGIYNVGTATVSTSTLVGNIAYGSGGGVFSGADPSTLTVASSTVVTNQASKGGGIAVQDAAAEVRNSTVSENVAFNGPGGGHAISLSLKALDQNHAMQATSRIINSTYSRNRSTVPVTRRLLMNSLPAISAGGGIYSDGVITEMISAIVAENVADANPDIEDMGTILVASNNLIGVDNPSDPGNHSIVNGVNGNQVGSPQHPINPRLGPLADNGGPTLTQALLIGSPAIGAGANPDDLEFDQRGSPFLRTIRGRTDVGAFECQHDCIAEIEERHKCSNRRQERGSDFGFVGGLPFPPPPPPPPLPAPIPAVAAPALLPPLPSGTPSDAAKIDESNNKIDSSIGVSPSANSSSGSSGCSATTAADPFMGLALIMLAILRNALRFTKQHFRKQ